MKNFYYIISFNLTHPSVKQMIKRQSLFSEGEPIIDFKIRSRPFMTFSEATLSSHKDYVKKHEALFLEEANNNDVHHICVINPDFMIEAGAREEIIDKFGHGATTNWSDNCCGVLWFASRECDKCCGTDFGNITIPDASDVANSWMIKYEIMTCDDMIELPGNGDFVFSSSSNEISTYH